MSDWGATDRPIGNGCGEKGAWQRGGGQESRPCWRLDSKKKTGVQTNKGLQLDWV